MRLAVRIRLAYIIVFVIPVVLILATVFGVFRYSLNELTKRYDLDKAHYEMILDPMQMLGHTASSVVKELEGVSISDPDKLTDEAYLAEVNERLAAYSSYLVVWHDNEVLYSGLPEEHNDPAYVRHQHGPEEEKGIYMMGDTPFQVRLKGFEFKDGSQGLIMVYTNVSQILPQTRQLLTRLIILALGVLSITSAVAMFGLYNSIIRPLDKLKKAAETMTAGNLNVSVTAESDDEIGELCVAFEEMRLKLKSQIEQNMQYEKDSKELISNISHDLKTPMTSIKGYVEGLMDGVADTPQKQERYIKTIYNKVNDMQSLIEELFLYAKLDSNAVTYNFVKLNLSAYFQDCVEEISLDLEAQDVDFEYFNYVDERTVIIADPEQLKRVINNIVSNSVKYASPDRKPAISFRLIEEAEFVKVEIEDNGRGISKDEIPFIFDRSYRTDASRNSSMGGSGLGLAIAKKIIEEHGGKIWAVSKENIGTTICFVLRKYKETIIE